MSAPTEPRRTTAEQDASDLARGAGVNYLGFVVRLGARIPFLFLAGLLYGEAVFGEFTFGITVAETAAALALFGLRRSLFKFMSDAVAAGEDVHGPVAHGIAVAVPAGLVATLVVGLGAGWIAELLRLPSAAGTLLLLSAAVPLIVLSDILLVAIRFTRQMRFEVWARSVAEPIVLTAAVPVAYWLGAREAGLAIAYVLSLAAAAGLSAWFFARLYSLRRCLRVRLRADRLRSLIGFSGPTAAYDMLQLVADKVDILLIAYFSPPSVVGVYGMARQFTTVTKKIRYGFDRILAPVLSQSIAAGDLARARAQLATVARWILSLETLLVLFFAFYADELLGLLGGGFAEGALVVLLLALGDAVNGSVGVAELPIVYLRPGANVVLGSALLALMVAGNLWLIPPLGAEGAALAVAAAYALVNAGRVAANRWLFDIWTLNAAILKPVVAALPAAAVVLALERLVAPGSVAVVAVGLPLLVVAYLGTLRLLGLEPEDRAQLRRARRKVIRALGFGAPPAG